MVKLSKKAASLRAKKAWKTRKLNLITPNYDPGMAGFDLPKVYSADARYISTVTALEEAINGLIARIETQTVRIKGMM